MSDVQWIKLKTDIFSDEKVKIIESLPNGKAVILIWLKLLCQAGRSNNDGHIFLRKNLPFTSENLATLFNENHNVILQALEILKEFELIKIDSKQRIMIPNWRKHQNFEGLERMKVQNRERQKRYRSKVKSNVTDNVTRNGKITLCNGIEKNRIEKNIYSEESTEYRLALLLFSQIKNRNPKQKEPDFQTWAKSIDLLIRKDEQSPGDVEKVILWCQQDNFWKNNILSTKKLREKFDQLFLKMNSCKKSSHSTPSPVMQKILKGASNDK